MTFKIPAGWNNNPQDSEETLVALEEPAPCDGIQCGVSSVPGEFHHGHVVVSGQRPVAAPRYFPVAVYIGDS